MTKNNFKFPYINTKTAFNGGVLSSFFIETNFIVFLDITYFPRVSPTTRATETLYHLILLAQTKITADITDYHGIHVKKQNFQLNAYNYINLSS